MPNEKVLNELREAAKKAAEAGYYAQYLVAVVEVALRGYPQNPDDERSNAS